MHGQSLNLLSTWFTNSKIIGVDITNEYLHKLENSNIEFFLSNAYHEDFIATFEDLFFDYIIDDGPHDLNSQLNCVKYWFRKLKISGKLIIEDIQNLESQKLYFDELNIPYEIVDLRKNKNRYDDVLLILTKQ